MWNGIVGNVQKIKTSANYSQKKPETLKNCLWMHRSDF